MIYHKWNKRFLMSGTFSIDDVCEILMDLKNMEDNNKRFLTHLDQIVATCDISWWDGDFPIEEVLERINKS